MACILGTKPAGAIENFNAGNLSDVNQQAVESLIKTVAIGYDHRPFMPASPLELAIGLDIGVDIVAVKFPAETVQALRLATDRDNIPSTVPIPRFSIHKGLPWGIDLGMSWVSYQGNRIVGFDAKWAFLREKEHLPIVAFRTSANYLKLFFLETSTYKFDLLVSKKLGFLIEPYFGFGLQVASGKLEVASGSLPAGVSGEASQVSPHLYLGLPLSLAILRLTAEYDYSFAGISSYGFKIGFSF